MRLPCRFTPSRAAYLTLSMAIACATLTAKAAETVDFRFSPPQWQATICFPDDPHKSLVSRDGELLYGYPDEEHKREFATRVGVASIEGAQWRKQELLAPRIPIVRTFRQAKGLEIVEEAFSVGGKARGDMILVHISNKSAKARSFNPRIVIDTTRALKFDRAGQAALIDRNDTVTTSLKMISLTDAATPRRLLRLESLAVAGGKSADFFVFYTIGGANAQSPLSLEQALVLRQKAADFWQSAPLPYDRVQVPDAGIQGLFDAAIRNIWQSREIKNGLPAFQVGPTAYHGLWIVDGAFILEAATILGAGKDTRGGVSYELTYQQPDGDIEAMRTIERSRNSPLFREHAQDFYYSKENGIVLWTLLRHAQLTQDKAWLDSLWPRVEKIAEHTRALRQKTLANDTALDDGLVPPDFTDGGQEGFVPEYSNAYWNLVGLHSFIAAARWLGKDQVAAKWQTEYDDFMRVFRKAAKRDMKVDGYGNHYLPNRMDGQDLPQRAQWAFLHAVYPGQLFAKNDPLVTGNLAMLEATEQEGMVYGTGGLEKGIWGYFGSFYAHAWLWQGNGAKAEKELYAYANHASPVLDWVEEQSLKGSEPYEQGGDMPHNWASAEFIRLVVHLLALDRGSELHLLEGLPLEWTRGGAVTRLNGVATPFGPLTMELKVSADRRSVHLHIGPLSDPSCSKIVVHLGGLAKDGAAQLLELDPKQPHDSVIWLKPDSRLSAQPGAPADENHSY